MSGATLLMGILTGTTSGPSLVDARATLVVEPARVVAAIQLVPMPQSTLIEE